MHETSKACIRRCRDASFRSRYFMGYGIDIGGGLDSLSQQITRFPEIKAVRNWDLEDGDAQYLNGVSDNSFDFVYSSHCLEHMQDPVIALKHWLRVLKPGGYLVVTVPDEDMYEHGIWPSRFNADHKWSFTLFKDFPLLPKSVNVMDLVKEFSLEIECERIFKIKDGYIDGLIDVDQTMGNAECAIEFVWQKQAPNPEQLMRIAYSFEKQGQTQKALDLYIRVIQGAPLSFDAYNQFSNLLARKGYIAEAENAWNVCVQNMPESRIARMYQALFLISIGRYDEGFRLRDALVPDERRTPTAPPTTYPRWQGESLKNKSIVIWTEFGFGDEIMFARFAEVFKQDYEAAKVSIVCQKPLWALFKTMPKVDAVVSEEDVDKLPSHDFWVFPHSIPVHYSLEKNSIPSSKTYFEVSKEDLDKSKNLLPVKAAGRIRVGLVTKGAPTHENDQLRSISGLVELQELFQIPGIDWIDLQKGIPLGGFDQISLPKDTSVTHLGEQLTDFMQTGAICSQLDLVICVDTSVAHLAGALNVPVWLMLSTCVDWRWGVNQSQSPWYPSMTIFRQENIGDWSNVVKDIHLGLCQKLRQVPTLTMRKVV